MSKLVPILFLLLVVPASALAVYAIVWIMGTRRGPKRLFWSLVFLALTAVVTLVFRLDLTPVSHSYWEQQKMAVVNRAMPGLVGIPLSFSKPVYRYESARSFNGDGYSISVYELTSEMAHYFSAPPSDFFAKYPKNPTNRSEWHVGNWRTGPPRENEQNFVRFAFGEHSTKEQPRLEQVFETIRRSLAKSTTLYAYCHHYPSEGIGDIDFFVIDPQERRFYIIQKNT